MTQPMIGITPSPSRDALAHGTFLRYATAAPYVEAVLAAGGVPVILPPQEGNVAALLLAIDGVLLSGGGDVEPRRYGVDRVHETTYGISPERDEFELALATAAIERDVPVLGICRGIQVLNVALGGTLIQDIAAEHDAEVRVRHRQQEDGLAHDAVGHRVAVAAGTTLERLFGVGEIGVNSFHHQAVDRLAPDLVPTAYAADGIVEAAEMPGRSFVVGVQWHPELMFERHEEQLRPFAALVEAARTARLETAGM